MNIYNSQSSTGNATSCEACGIILEHLYHSYIDGDGPKRKNRLAGKFFPFHLNTIAVRQCVRLRQGCKLCGEFLDIIEAAELQDIDIEGVTLANHLFDESGPEW
jgi:hypothetical protein